MVVPGYTRIGALGEGGPAGRQWIQHPGSGRWCEASIPIGQSLPVETHSRSVENLKAGHSGGFPFYSSAALPKLVPPSQLAGLRRPCAHAPSPSPDLMHLKFKCVCAAHSSHRCCWREKPAGAAATTCCRSTGRWLTGEQEDSGGGNAVRNKRTAKGAM